MKRIVLMVTVALVMAAMMALMAMPALAAIHPLARMECAQDSSQSEVVETQDPPGLIKPGNEARPVLAVGGNDTAASHAFKDDVCPPAP
jgi:hypothetical protein